METLKEKEISQAEANHGLSFAVFEAVDVELTCIDFESFLIGYGDKQLLKEFRKEFGQWLENK